MNKFQAEYGAVFSTMWQVYGNGPIPTMVINSHGVIVAVNEAMAQLYGLQTPILGNVFDLIPLFYSEESRNCVEKNLRETIEGKLQVRRFEHSFIRSDGKECFVESTIFDLSVGSGMSGLFLIHGADITEKKRMEEALRSSEKRFRSLVATAPDGIVMTDADGIIVELNDAFASLYGFEREEMLGRNFFDFIPDFESRLNLEQMFIMLARKGAIFPQEITIMSKYGIQIPVEFSIAILKDERGTVKNLIAVSRDLSMRNKAENAFRLSEQKYRDLIESISDVVYACDEKGVITYISSSVEHITGFSPDEIIGKDILSFIHSGDRDRSQRDFEGVKKGYYCKSEYRVATKSGEYVWVLASVSPIFENERFVGIHGLSSDITERKLAEEDLRKTREELEIKSNHLEDANTALRVLLQHQEEDKRQQENDIYNGITKLVTPYMEKIKNSVSDEQILKYLDIISTNLTKITKPYSSKLSEQYSKLTPTEMQIATLIRENRSTREISEILCISETTVFFHRRNLRDKLGLKNNHVNLRSYLQSLDALSVDTAYTG